MKRRAGTRRAPRRSPRALLFLLPCAAFPFALAGCARPLTEPPPLSSFLGRATGFSESDVDDHLSRAEVDYRKQDAASVKRAMENWQTAAAADRTRVEGLIGMARAGVWLAEHLNDPNDRLDAATRALQAAQWCGRIASGDVSCEYWLGAALGVRAREKPSTALKALPVIEQAFMAAAERKPAMEEGGPDRALALLYLRAPAWPTGPGDPERGLLCARKAVALKPDYAPNQLVLGEALAATRDAGASRAAYERALDLARGSALTVGPEAEEWAREAERALGNDEPDSPGS